MDWHLKELQIFEKRLHLYTKGISTNLKGKRLRPRLIFLVGASLKVSFKELLDYALMVELIHNASLIHDDVIDSAISRRNKASLNIKYSNRRAILIGDYLLTHLFKLKLLKKIDPIPVTKLIDIVQKMIVSELNPPKKTVNAIIKWHTLKTANLFAWCSYLPAYLAKSKLANDYYKWGKILGQIYQLKDDLLDYKKEDLNLINCLGLEKSNNYLFNLQNKIQSSPLFNAIAFNRFFKEHFF